MEHILIVGGAYHLHESFYKAGFKITLLIPTKNIHRVNPMIYSRIIAIKDDSPEDEWINTIESIHEKDPFHFIHTLGESGQFLALKIANKLDLKYHSPKTLEAVFNKEVMRKILHAERLDDTPFLKTKHKEAVLDFAKANGYPIVLKPQSGVGSMDVHVIQNEETLLSLLNESEYRYNSEFYVEKFIPGEEFSVEAVSVNGKHRIVTITKKYTFSEHCIEVGHCVPAFVSTDIKYRINSYVNKVLNVLGVKDAITHTEVKVTQSDVRIIETHTRMGGDFIGRLVELSFDTELGYYFANSLLDNKFLDHDPKWNGTYSCIRYKPPHKEGIIKKIHGIDEARAYHDYIKEVFILKNEGDYVGKIGNCNRLAAIILNGEDYNKINQIGEEALDLLKFEIE